MAITNETKYVTVRRLNRFKEKLDTKISDSLSDYAQKSELATVATSGSYNDLVDKPVPFSPSGTNHSSGLVPDPGATQGNTKYLREDGTWAVPESGGVQSDWNQTDSTADDFIKNKPTIPDATNFVEKSQTAGLLKNDGTVDTNTYLTSAPVTSVNGSTGAVVISNATTSAAGLMSSTDKTKINKALTEDDIALLSDAELGSWFGYAADSTMVTTTLPGVSDDSITDE